MNELQQKFARIKKLYQKEIEAQKIVTDLESL